MVSERRQARQQSSVDPAKDFVKYSIENAAERLTTEQVLTPLPRHCQILNWKRLPQQSRREAATPADSRRAICQILNSKRRGTAAPGLVGIYLSVDLNLAVELTCFEQRVVTTVLVLALIGDHKITLPFILVGSTGYLR